MKKILLVFLFASRVLLAQEADSTDLANLLTLKAETESSDLQKKLNENVGAASKKSLSSRETPGIVSVIKSEDIQKTGARDLMDVLRLVPGFDFASDVNFVTGLSLRGAWSMEGKILVLLDGMELNDLLYQNVAFFNRFPVNLIHRIEIIRGPGSAVYGGTAEYGVINIITKGAAGVEGLQAAATYGALPDNFGRKNFEIGISKSIKPNVNFDASFFRGSAIKSDQNYQDLYQSTPELNLTSSSVTDTYNANVGFKVNGLQLRSILESYKSADPDISTEFKNYFLNARYDFKVGEKLTVTPFGYFTSQTPWKQIQLSDQSGYFETRANRIKGGVYGSYDFNRRLNLIVGSEYFEDQAESKLDPTYFNGNPDVNFHLYSFYAQALIKHRFVNITGGFRFDKHNAFGGAFVPRLALTKRIDNLHFKILASGSYRVPGIDNINLGNNIKPERSTVYEIELGYQLTPDMLLIGNAYHVQTSDIIIYNYTDLGGGNFDQGYENEKRFGTQGVEVAYTLKKSKWNVDANYSFYQAGHSSVERYAVDGDKSKFIGIPQTKLAVVAGFNITRNLGINASINHFGERVAYITIDTDELPITSSLNPYTLINFNLCYSNLFTPGLSVSIGGYDLLNEKPVIPQAYNGDWAPLSGRSREFTLKLMYAIPFSKK